MKVTINYNQMDYDRTVDFIAAKKKKLHNESFKKMLRAELDSLIDDVKNVVKPNNTLCSTSSMGFFVNVEDIQQESIDNDDFIVSIKILVDLSDDYILSSREYEVDLDE